MKKIVLILILGVFAFGSSGFKTADVQLNEESSTSCFDLARAAVIAEDGEINTGNIDQVRFLTFVCEFYDLNVLYP